MNKIKERIRKLLVWSERYLKTDMIYLSKSGFWSISNFVISASLGFGLTLLFANFLDKESYGIYKYIFSIYGLLGAVSFSGIDVLIIRSVANGFEGILRRSLTYSLRWNIPYFLVSLGVSGYYYFNANNQLALIFFIIAVLAPITASFNVYISFLNGKKDFKLQSMCNSAASLLSAISTFFLIIYTKNPVLIASAYFVINALVSIFCYNLTLKKHRPNNSFEEDSLERGKHYSLMNILTVAGQNLDKIVVFHFLGGTSLAIYAFAQAPINQFLAMLKSIGPIYSPKILAQSKEQNKAILPKKFFHIMMIMIFPVFAYIFIAPYFYNLFFPQYSEAIIYSQIYVLVLFLYGKKFIAVPLPIYCSKKSLYAMSVINALLSIVPKITLIYFFGLLGAVIGEIISNTLITAVSFYYLKNKM